MTILQQFFESEQIDNEAMYFIEMHGFLTSIAIQAGSLSQQQILDEIFATTAVDDTMATQITELQNDIEQSLLKGDFPDIISDDEDEDSLTLWAAGFMQGVFSQEKLWFDAHPEEVAELTLPILSCSELLDDETGDMQHDDEMLDDMAEKIPDCVIDLYLLFNAPEDK